MTTMAYKKETTKKTTGTKRVWEQKKQTQETKKKWDISPEELQKYIDRW